MLKKPTMRLPTYKGTANTDIYFFTSRTPYKNVLLLDVGRRNIQTTPSWVITKLLSEHLSSLAPPDVGREGHSVQAQLSRRP